MKKKVLKKTIHGLLDKIIDNSITYLIVGGIAVILGLIIDSIISTILDVEAIFVYAAIITGVFMITVLILMVLMIIFIALDQ